MKLYQHLDLPYVEEIKQAIVPQIPNFFFENTVFKTYPREKFAFPQLIESVEKIKPWTEVSHLGIITTMPWAHTGKESDTYIHVDVMSKTEHGQEQAVCLNYPLFNCDATYVAYYESKEPAYFTQAEYGNGVKFEAYHFKKEWCTEIDRMYLPKPSLFYTQLPHGIINETNESRIVLSVRFSTPIDLETFELKS